MSDNRIDVEPVTNLAEDAEVAPREPKKNPRRVIAAAIAAVVVIAAGIGAWTWHEQPSFCNALCHEPMDHHVENYYADDPTIGAALHRTAGAACLDCHEPRLDEQVSEAAKWVSGDFDNPVTAFVEVGKSTCMTESCHNLSTEQFSSLSPDHDGIIAYDAPCSSCHAMHDAGKLFPEGSSRR